MTRKLILVEEAFAEWRKDPAYMQALQCARGRILARRGND
jgi:hypothetical protein